MAPDEERNAPDRGPAGGSSATGSRTAPAFAPHVVVLATIGWALLQVLNLASMESGHARVVHFEQPARTAARLIERPVEVVAASLVGAERASEDEPFQLEGLTGSGPFGLDPSTYEGVAVQLLDAALDVDLAASEMRDAAERGAKAETPDATADRKEDARLERATRLEREAAVLTARARILGAAVGLDAAELERATPRLVAKADVRERAELDGSTVQRLLAGDAAWAARTEALVLEFAARSTDDATDVSAASVDPRGPVADEIPMQLDGLPELLLLDARGEVPPVEEWAVSEAIGRAAAPMGFVLVLAPFSIVFALLLVATRRRILAPTAALSARLDAQDGWGAFAFGQLGFGLVLTLLASAGAGALTGYNVALSSIPILVAALVAAGWRPGLAGSLGTAGERLGLDGDARTAPRALVCGLGLVPVLWLGVLALAALGPLEASPWTSPYMDQLMDGGIDTWRRMAIEAGVGAPIFEELAFRGVLFAALRSRMGFLPAAGISAVVFAVGHPYDLAGMLTIAWIGFALAWLYERTGSLVACMAAHSAYNLSSLVYTLIYI
ncbi:CAAX amino terminal protease self- immunity [Planctomycetes bacterium Pla163]|uniref:CAAX amino terminal protease self-immunity n=1 Tax=Rohdeia mirabilis TaxID=2528008 RepID=A0A518D4X6_9BACT|nr:CAAX amino terminal protease self- immunity [Planctomycetes bacterium Pla163]